MTTRRILPACFTILALGAAALTGCAADPEDEVAGTSSSQALGNSKCGDSATLTEARALQYVRSRQQEYPNIQIKVQDEDWSEFVAEMGNAADDFEGSCKKWGLVTNFDDACITACRNFEVDRSAPTLRNYARDNFRRKCEASCYDISAR